MAQYRELAAFAQFGSDLDKATQAQLNRGARLVEVLKQDQYVPLPVAKQVIAIFAGTNGYLDDMPVDRCRPFEKFLYSFLDSSRPDVERKIMEKKELTDDLRNEIHSALREAKQRFLEQQKAG